jgi:hypothetical protein
MKNSNLKTAWRNLCLSLKNNSGKDKISRIKEEVILSRLSKKLGKSKEEVKGIVSEGLMALLTKVPLQKLIR